MAKNIKRVLAITLVLTLCFMLMAPTASAWGWGPPGGGNNDAYEWYEVYVQGKKVASGKGNPGNVYYLGTHYNAGVDINGSSLTWYINPVGGSSGNFSGTVNLADFITIPEGYEVKEYNIEELSIDGVNDPYHDMYDNAIIRITIKSLYNEDTDDTIIIPDPEPSESTEPEVTEPSEPSEPVIPDPVDYAPVLSIVKTADKAVYKVGETITWTITVTNTGADTAYGVTVSDPLTGDSWSIDYLASGESCTFTATATATQAGSLENVAIASWTDGDEIPDEEETDEPRTVSDDEIVTIEEPVIPDPVDHEPVLTIEKTADKAVYEVGETITWTITVTNTGSYLAYDVNIEDPLTGDSWYIAYLIPGASRSFETTSTATLAGSLENVATATWTDGDEIPDEEELDEEKSVSDDEIVTITEPEVTEPEVTEPEVTEPEVTEPEVTEPEVTEPEVTEPEVTEPEVTEPEVTEPEVTEPEVTEPEVTEPEVTEPEVTEPEVTEPEVTEPEVTEPEVTEPEVTEPEVTEPEVTEPEVTEPEVTEPEVTEPDEIEPVPVPDLDPDPTPNPTPIPPLPTEPEPEPTEPEVTEPEETDPTPEPDPQPNPEPQPPQPPHIPVPVKEETEIPDDDVPLADVPVTGDLAILWAALSVFSGTTLVALNKKRDEEE